MIYTSDQRKGFTTGGGAGGLEANSVVAMRSGIFR